MTKEFQKSLECQFAKKTGEFLNKEWVLEEYEKPDFIVTENAQKFGLEVCQIFTGMQDKKGSQSKKNEAGNQKHIDLYRRKYEFEENALLHVQLVGETCDENMEEVVQLLIEKELSQKPPGYHEEFEVPPSVEDMIASNPESERHEILEEWLSRYWGRRSLTVNVRRLPDSFPRRSDDWYSVNDRVGWVGSATDQIVSAIEEKSKKLLQYKECSGLDDIRLLIVADHLRASGMLELREHREFDPKGFQMIYFLNYPSSADVIGCVSNAA